MDVESLISDVDPKTLKRQRDTILNVIMCPEKHRLTDAQVRNIEPIVDMIDSILNLREDMRKAYEASKADRKKTMVADRVIDYDRPSDLSYRKKNGDPLVMIYNMDRFEGHAEIVKVDGKDHVILNGAPVGLDKISARKR